MKVRTKYTSKWFKNRKTITSCHRVWFNLRFLSVMFLFFIIKFAIPAFTLRFDPTLPPKPQLISMLKSFIFIISIPSYFFCRAVQYACQNDIDDTLLDKPTWHFAEIIPLKGIWVHRREAFLYNMRARRFKRAIRKSVAFAQTLEERRVRRFHRSNLPFSKKRKEAKEAAAKKKARRKKAKAWLKARGKR